MFLQPILREESREARKHLIYTTLLAKLYWHPGVPMVPQIPG